MAIVPKNRPAADRERVRKKAEVAWKAAKPGQPFPKVVVVGVRGYFQDTMGKVGTNDRGIYDDAVFVLSPEAFVSFNANVDPSAWRKGIATLKPGIHPYKPGNHGISKPGGGYPAFRPNTKDEELPVWRDGVDKPSPGVAINIHKGGYGTTSSEGCQTIYPDQWDAFYALVRSEMKKFGQKGFDYILLEFQG